MIEFTYEPEHAGKLVVNSRKKMVKVRKYHMTEEEMIRDREEWEENIKKVNNKLIKKAGKHFFNPYRKGIYYFQVQALFLLGANEWHSLEFIVEKVKKLMSSIPVKITNNMLSNLWEKFKNKSSRVDAVRCKDHIGRIQENMFFLQRLSKLHPYGYKLRQVFSAIDIKRVSVKELPNGCFFYRLSTYNTIEEAFPKRDFKDFKFIKNKGKYINNKFIGTIITNDKIIKGAKI